jgi:hypothetical protein
MIEPDRMELLSKAFAFLAVLEIGFITMLYHNVPPTPLSGHVLLLLKHH